MTAAPPEQGTGGPAAAVPTPGPTHLPTPLPVPSVDAAPASQPSPWPHRHLLDLDVVSWPEIELVMRTAEAMKEVLARPIARVPALRGTGVTILFYEASTRTRVSF